ncbi:Trm112 family protein [Nocardioides sp. GCM10027113]|uniref:Trm112 family protein n=1 Tax=unclassified Nocardioides TaxID=2615069 RepID=UPI003611C123
MNLDPALLAIIVCPACHGELSEQTSGEAGEQQTELVCGSCGLAYPVRDGIPVLLVDEARKPA